MAKDKVKFNIQTANDSDLFYMLGKWRKEDVAEIWASSGMSANEAVYESYKASKFAWTVFVDDDPVAVFGVVPASPDSLELGIPWFVGTDGVRKVRREFLTRGPEYLLIMLHHFNYLINYVDARNKESIRLLKWYGFKVEEAEEHGPEGLPFHMFWMKKRGK
jgi:hypothetical protein